MGGGQNETPRGWQADTGQGGHKAEAAGTSKLAQAKGRAKRACVYQVQPEIGDAFAIQVTGREAWAFDRLREAGARGCTPRTEPAPRWSAYVFNLRGLAPARRSLDQLRGIEGQRVRHAYLFLAQQHGVDWKQRKYDPGDWDKADIPNRCLSAATSCLQF